MKSHRPDGIVCANDRTAGKLMHSLRLLKYRVPKDVRLVGIDDVEYAKLLPVPLTTLRQPTLQIGQAAVALMLERIAQRDLPPREVRLHCRSEEHTSELQSRLHLVCRLLLEKNKRSKSIATAVRSP